MNLAIFGTGYIYQKFKNNIHGNICCLVDNAKEKQGTFIDGIKVSRPCELLKSDFSYIIIMVSAYEKIKEQLLCIGIEEKKIIPYIQLADLNSAYPKVSSKGVKIELKDWIKIHNLEKKFLLVSHDFSYSGVPVAVMNMAKVIKAMGYTVIMSGLQGGDLHKELEINEIDYMEEIAICYGTKWFERYIRQFDMVVAGTFVINDFVRIIQQYGINMIWWLHESNRLLFQNTNILFIKDNVKIYGGGNRVLKIFRECFKDVEIQKLQYCIPDTFQRMIPKKEKKEKLVFALIGAIESRKGQDIAVKAVKKVADIYKDAFELILIGKESLAEPEYCINLEREIADIEEIKLLGVMNQKQLDEQIANIDVLLCPSRDDPMPIVVTQAMMHKKICIISDCVGQAEYIINEENGFIFENENVEQLRDYIAWIIQHQNQLYYLGENARKIYDKEFSMESMKRNLQNIIDKWG